MLAQNFLDPIYLDCSTRDRAAAITVLGMLERGELVHVSGPAPGIENGFTMATWWHGDCGTCGCIGGWMEHVKGRVLTTECAENWLDLFAPKGWKERPAEYTIERCARALRAKLTTGRADWSEA